MDTFSISTVFFFYCIYYLLTISRNIMLDTHTHTHTGLSCPIKIMHSPYIVFLFVSGFLCLKVLAFQMLSGNIVTESSLVYLNGNLLCLYKCLWLYIRRRGGLCIPPVNIIRNLKLGPRGTRIIKEGLRGSCQYLFACLPHKPFLLHVDMNFTFICLFFFFSIVT